MEPAIVVLVILGLAVLAFLSNKVPPGVVALSCAAALFLTGSLPFEATIAGFGDPVVIFIASLFVVSAALEITGVTGWISVQLIEKVGSARSSVLLGLMAMGALLTALISVNGAVAALVPVAVVLALRTSQPPSRLLIPLAFAGHAGSLLTLMGSPVNLIVSELSFEAGGGYFGFFQFAIAGIPVVIGTFLIVLLLGPKLLPDRVAVGAARDLSGHVETLVEHYDIDADDLTLDTVQGVSEMIITPRSPMVGRRAFPGLRVAGDTLIIVAIQRAGQDVTDVTLAGGDIILLRGPWESLRFQAENVDGAVVVDHPEAVRMQAGALGVKALKAVVVVALMVFGLALGVAPPAFVALSAALAMVLLGVVTVPEAHRSLSLTTLIVIAGMIPLSVAIKTSGAGDLIADGLMAFLGDFPPRVVLLGLVIVVLVLGQFTSNVATVLIVAPIAVSVAEIGGYSVVPFMMGLCVSGAAALFTPIATPANLMIMAPGGYRFSDYWKMGLPLAALYIAVSVLLVPLVWPF